MSGLLACGISEGHLMQTTGRGYGETRRVLGNILRGHTIEESQVLIPARTAVQAKFVP